MSTPSNALQTAIYTRLSADAPLTALLGSGKVFDFVPQGVAAPYVLIGDDTAIDWSTKSGNGWETTITIHAWDFEKAGRKSVKAILSAIYDSLHRASLTVTGFSVVELHFEFEQTFQDTTPEGERDHYYHGVQRYRALIKA